MNDFFVLLFTSDQAYSSYVKTVLNKKKFNRKVLHMITDKKS